MKKVFVFLILFAAVGVISLTVQVNETNASCALPAMGGFWGNPNPNGYVLGIEIDLPCLDRDGGNRLSTYVYGNNRIQTWPDDRIDEIGRNANSGQITMVKDQRRWSSADTTQTVTLLNSNRLKVVTFVDIHGSSTNDFTKTDYLQRTIDGPFSRNVDAMAFACGTGCVTGGDVDYVNFIIWTSDGQIHTQRENHDLFCAEGNVTGAPCNTLPRNWLRIQAEIWMNNGTSQSISWQR